MNDFETKANFKFMIKLGWKGAKIVEALGNVYGLMLPKKCCL